MNEKKIQLLAYLMQLKSWVTAAEISVAVGCSVRSVKSYIAELNSAYPNIIESSRNGFHLKNYTDAAQIIKNSTSSIPQNSEGRISYIIKKLLMEGLSYDLDQMAEDLCISPLTLHNEINRLKSKLGKFDLVFKTKNNLATIEGSEKNKKKLISHLIYEETKDFCCNLELLQLYLPELDLKIIKHIITNILLKNRLFIDDFALLNFILHLAIAMERSKEGIYSMEPVPENTDVIIAPLIKDIMVTVLIVCPQYYSIHLNLVKKISMIFEDDIIITGVVSYADEIPNNKEYQFIISTIPIIPHPPVPLVQIPVQLGNKEIAVIASVIENIKKQKLKNKMEQKLKYLFYEDLIFFNHDFPSENEAIEFLCDALEKKEFVNPSYKKSIYERESISPSAYSNIAIPHPFEMCALQSAIAVSIHAA